MLELDSLARFSYSFSLQLNVGWIEIPCTDNRMGQLAAEVELGVGTFFADVHIKGEN